MYLVSVMQLFLHEIQSESIFLGKSSFSHKESASRSVHSWTPWQGAKDFAARTITPTMELLCCYISLSTMQCSDSSSIAASSPSCSPFEGGAPSTATDTRFFDCFGGIHFCCGYTSSHSTKLELNFYHPSTFFRICLVLRSFDPRPKACPLHRSCSVVLITMDRVAGQQSGVGQQR